MRIAIIGAGFAGLAVAFYLSQDRRVNELTLFDPLGIGGGASGVASGLCHPYAGEVIRRSLEATEALETLRSLVDVVEGEQGTIVSRRDGVIRYAQTDVQKEQLRHHGAIFGDVMEQEGGEFLISSGMTLYAKPYMEALFVLLQKRGVQWVCASVDRLESLQHYDHCVIAAGKGSLSFAACASLQVSLVKGQIWQALGEPHLLQRSLIGKGYVALDLNPSLYHLGSTYERGWAVEGVQEEVGRDATLAKIAQFFPQSSQMKIMSCRAGIRVTCRGHYFPIIKALDHRVWVFTGLGSRGILYHAHLGQRLAKAILQEKA